MKLTDKLNLIVNQLTNRKRLVATITIALAVVVIVIGYYNGWFNNWLKGKTQAAANQEWHLTNKDDYNATTGITFDDTYATVDLEYNPAPAFNFAISPYPNITDVWYNGSDLLGAAVDANQEVAYSFYNTVTNLWSDWFGFPLAYDIKVKRIASTGAFNNTIFGLGSTTDGNNGAVVLAAASFSGMSNITYINLNTDIPGPAINAKDVTAGIQYNNRLYAGLTPQTPGPNSFGVLSTDNNLLGAIVRTTMPWVSSVNNFLSVDSPSRLYATTTQATGHIEQGKALIWYTDDNGASWQEATLDPSDPLTSHSTTLGIVDDSEGYIYATTDQNYILKSTFPKGDIFRKLIVPNPSGSKMNFLYSDSKNNIWVPLDNGKFLRSVDYTAGVGAERFFVTNSTSFSYAGASAIRITSAVKLSTGEMLWAGGAWVGSTPIKGVGWKVSTATDQYFINKTGIAFSSLTSFSAQINAETADQVFKFKYRISHTSADGPWYWYYADPLGNSGWEMAADVNLNDTNLEKANTANEINTNLSQFITDVGVGNELFYFQAIYTQDPADLVPHDVVLDSINLGYEPPKVLTSFLVDVPPFTQLNTNFDFTVTAVDQNGDTLTNFNQTLLVRSNMTGNLVDGDDGQLIGCTAETWQNGVLKYNSCQVKQASNPAVRYIGAGYVDNSQIPPVTIYDTDTTVVVDPELEALDYFDVVANPPAIGVDEAFTITVEAHIPDTLGGFIKPNFSNPTTIIADGNGDDLDDGVITPQVIGDGLNAGNWVNGVATYDQYKISVANPTPYKIIAQYGTVTGFTTIYVSAGHTLNPVIISMNPSSGPVGVEVTLAGINFGTMAGTIYFGSAIASLKNGTLWNDINLIAVAPDPVGGILSVMVKIISSDGLASNEMQYTYTGPGDPVINSIDPNHGTPLGGTLVTLDGQYFGNSLGTVQFIGIGQATVLSWTSNSVMVVSPPSVPSGTVAIRLTTSAGLVSNPMGYTYDSVNGVAPVLARYHSKSFAVTELASLDDITILAKGYGANIYDGAERTIIAVGLFTTADDTTPLGAGDDGMNTGYYLLTDNHDNNIAKLTALSLLPNFKDVQSIKFRIDLYTPDPTDSTLQPWVESITLNYTLASGTIGTLDFVGSASKNVSESAPVTTPPFDVNAVAGTFGGSYAMQIGIEWEASAPAGVTPVIAATGDLTNPVDTINPFESEMTYGIKVEFTAGAGAVFDGTSYNFRITGVDTTNASITLTPTIFGTLTLNANPSFLFTVNDDNQLSHPSGDVTYNMTIQHLNGFSTGIDLTTDATTVFAAEGITINPVFNPESPITAPGDVTLKFTLPSNIANLPKTLDFTITATATGFTPQVRSAHLNIEALAPDDFAIMVAEPHDQQTQANGSVVYEINLDYGTNFTSDVTLTTDIADASIFGANTFTSIVFDPSTVDNTISSATLTLSVGSTPDPLLLDTLKIFAITGTSVDDPTKTHNALASDGTDPALTINSTVFNTITISLTVPVQDTPSTILPSVFTLNLYPVGAVTKDDFAVSLSGLTPTSQDQINKIVTIDVQVSKDLLTDGAVYTVYTRSTRNFWVKSIADLTVDKGQATPHTVTFPIALAGDIKPTTSPGPDNTINGFDVTYVVNNYSREYDSSNPTDTGFLIADFNNDNLINIFDVGRVVNNWVMSGDPFFGPF